MRSHTKVGGWLLAVAGLVSGATAPHASFRQPVIDEIVASYDGNPGQLANGEGACFSTIFNPTLPTSDAARKLKAKSD